MDQITGLLDIDEVTSEVITSVVQSERIQASILLPTVMDVSQFARKGASSISFPKANSFVTQKKQSGTAVSAQKLTIGKDTLLLDQHAVIQGLIEDIASVQSEPALAALYFQRMASSQGLQIDVDLFNKIKNIDSGNMSGYTAGSAPTKKDFTKARKIMKDAHVPGDGQWYCLVGTANEKAIMDLEDFVDADKWLSGSEAAKLNALFPGGVASTGTVGRAYGFTILSSTVVPDSDNGMYFYHSSHVAIGFQMQPRLQEQYQLEHLALRVSMDQLYGVKELDGGFRAARIGA